MLKGGFRSGYERKNSARAKSSAFKMDGPPGEVASLTSARAAVNAMLGGGGLPLDRRSDGLSPDVRAGLSARRTKRDLP